MSHEFEKKLITEIDSLFDEYVKRNHLSAVASAKHLYRNEMEHICGSGRLHVKPDQLAEEHNQCRAIALNQLQQFGSQEFEMKLITEIDSLFDEYVKQNHLCAVSSAKDLYRNEMEHICGSSRPHVEPDQLGEKHNQCRAIALNQLQQMGSQEFETKLISEIGSLFDEYVTQNENLYAVASAKDLYRKEMEHICGGGRQHVEPDQLEEEHNQWRAIALNQLQQMGSQEFEMKLITEIDSLFDEYVKQNHLCAVSSAKDLYRNEMEHICGSGRPHVEPDQLEEKHNQWCAIALNQLQQMGSQKFETKLISEIGSLFDEYVTQNENLYAVASAKDLYRDQMEHICGSGRQHVEPHQLAEEHNQWRAIALNQFQHMGIVEEFETKLISEINSLFDEYVQRNENLYAVASAKDLYREKNGASLW